MPTYIENDLSSLVEAIRRAVDSAEAAGIWDYLLQNTEVTKGFRIKRSTCHQFRKVIFSHLINRKKLDDVARDLLYKGSLGQRFTVVLSCQALEALLHEFATIFGRDEFCLALLLDDRVDVRSLGQKLLEEHDLPDISVQAASKKVTDVLKEFITCFLPICSDGDMMGEWKFNHAPTRDLQERLRESEQHSSRLNRKIAKERAKRKKEGKKLTDAIRRISSECRELRQQVANRETALAQLQVELEELARDEDKRVQERIAARLKWISSQWFGRAQVLDDEVQEDARGDLLARADAAMLRQQQLDRHTENRKELQKRVKVYAAKLADVRSMRVHALNKLPQLEKIEAELVAEIVRLETLLRQGLKPLSVIASALAARIGISELGDDLTRIEELIVDLTQLGLDRREVSQLYRLIGERFDRLVAEHGERYVQVQVTSPFLRFRQALAQQEAVALICDGHNVVNNLPEFAASCRIGNGEARRALTSTMVRMFAGYPSCTATVVYDGPRYDKIEVEDNVVEIYSGGEAGDAHRADKAILQRLELHKYSGQGRQAYIVTDDQELAEAARGYGAEIIALWEFRGLLAE